MARGLLKSTEKETFSVGASRGGRWDSAEADALQEAKVVTEEMGSGSSDALSMTLSPWWYSELCIAGIVIARHLW